MSKSKQIVIDQKLFKRIQSQVNRRLSQHQTSISLGVVREHVVQNHTEMTEGEINLVVDELIDLCLGAQEKTMSLYQGEKVTVQDGLTTSSPLAMPTNAPVDAQPTTSEMVPIQQTQAQSSHISLSDNIDHSAICLAVQEHFAGETKAMQLELVNYLEEQTFSSMLQLRQALAELRKFRTDILRKLIADHNEASNQDLQQLRSALQLGQSQRQVQAVEETTNFLASLADKRAVFGL